MKKTNQDYNMQRRSFFLRLISGAAGISILGGLIPSFLKPGIFSKKSISLQVKIHPEAVSRTNKNDESHGS